MYFDDPAPAYAETDDLSQSVLIVATALFVSPIGYITIPFIGRFADNAASALF
jgi:NADH-quinone oxidoreductase subunit N